MKYMKYMKCIPEDDILQTGLDALLYMDERMHYKSKALYGLRTFNFGVLGANLIFILANLKHVQGAGYIKTTEDAVTSCHAIIKYSLFIYYKSDIEKLLDDMQEFWDIKQFDTQLSSKIETLYGNVKYGQCYYLVTGLCCIGMYYLKPAIDENNLYLFECWTFTNTFEMETLVLASQYWFWIIMFPVVFGYDSLYFAYAIHIIVQLRLLNHKLEVISEDVTFDEIKEYIRHHQLILSIFDRMKKIYFWMLLFHYFVTLISGCSLLYVIMLGGCGCFSCCDKLFAANCQILLCLFFYNSSTSERADQAAAVFYISGLLLQFAYYSFPVEEIVFELKNISNSIYLSSWYEKDLPVQSTLLFVMTKAQRQKYLSAGGIIDINVDAFGSVVRKVFSFYAILKNVVNK